MSADSEHGILKDMLENVSLIPTLDSLGENATEPAWPRTRSIVYITASFLCIILCIIAVIVNIRILICVKWIRRPLSPTIYISLSLAMADTSTAILIALVFLFHSLLPKFFNVTINNDCLFLVLEASRLSGILVSTIHLLALAANHYFGILCPFRSMTLLTPGNVRIVVLAIWLLPTIYIFAYFGSFENQAFQRLDCYIEKGKNFLQFSRFRTIFSVFFFIPMIIMFAIYIHISVIVRRHQANRRWLNRHSRRHQNMEQDQQRQLDRNLKAIWTSLLILSTYVICFMPVVIYFYMVCRDCYFTFDEVGPDNLIIAASITNILLITKYLINPLIYAARMSEIKLASRQMNAEFRRRLFYFRNLDELDPGGGGSQRLSLFTSSSRRQNTAVNSIQMRNGADRSARVMTTDL